MSHHDWLELTAVLLTMLAMVVGGIVGLYKVKDKIIKEVRLLHKDTQKDIEALRESLSGDIEEIKKDHNNARLSTEVEFGRMRQEFSDTLLALRTKIGDVEKYGLEFYARRESIELLVNRVERTLGEGLGRVERGVTDLTQRFNRMLEERAKAAS